MIMIIIKTTRITVCHYLPNSQPPLFSVDEFSDMFMFFPFYYSVTCLMCVVRRTARSCGNIYFSKRMGL